MSIYEYIYEFSAVFAKCVAYLMIFQSGVHQNLKKSSNMPKKLAKNEEKLWARRAGWHNLVHEVNTKFTY